MQKMQDAQETKSLVGPIQFCFKGCWVVFSIFIQILIEHYVSKQLGDHDQTLQFKMLTYYHLNFFFIKLNSGWLLLLLDGRF